MSTNWAAIIVSSFIPLIIGFIWYNPKAMGTAWMKAAGMNQEKMQGANMGVIFTLTFIFSFMLAMAMPTLVIHQQAVGALLLHGLQSTDAAVKASAEADLSNIMSKYGTEFRTFGHGALHGFMSALFIVLPVMAINSMFERKSWKYIWINFGYWAICFILMGGVICAWI